MTLDSSHELSDATRTVLTDRHKRQVLLVLIDHGDSGMRLDRLVSSLLDQLADAHESPFSDPKRLSIALHHIHLPALEEVGVIEYDPRSNAARYRPDEQIEEFVRTLEGEFA